MPREQITPMSQDAASDFDPKRNVPVHGEAWRTPGLHVGWTPNNDHNYGGEAQIIIDVDPRYLHHQIETYAATISPEAPIKIVTATLDRGELNKLIRTLRNARDKAYGSDE